MLSTGADRTLFDAGLFTGSLLSGDPRHAEARPLVEAGRRGTLRVCTTTSILSEGFGALTWIHALPPHTPAQAAEAVRLLVEPPSAIQLLGEDLAVALRMLDLAETHGLTGRRVHDARHAAAALQAGVQSVFTYDVEDWRAFQADGIQITGPPSILARL